MTVIISYAKRFLLFFKSIVGAVQHVTWPSRAVLCSTAGSIALVVCLIGILIAFFDFTVDRMIVFVKACL
jgi:preprotein translocase subunit SecE